ncbi:uncharacterized protein LOC125480136 isoform X2 [Pyrus x bretschneideri]|uniref:uncharacterized protein LOC125480136 isoform X2 n=1 Tax=Pyrus x bretschneideri TaxID=225117 RepID=UPI00202E9240|nr:uncharacterized protein LOC125480136 isoform X2 [Pyrus x bretschneideri]
MVQLVPARLLQIHLECSLQCLRCQLVAVEQFHMEFRAYLLLGLAFMSCFPYVYVRFGIPYGISSMPAVEQFHMEFRDAVMCFCRIRLHQIDSLSCPPPSTCREDFTTPPSPPPAREVWKLDINKRRRRRKNVRVEVVKKLSGLPTVDKPAPTCVRVSHLLTSRQLT